MTSNPLIEKLTSMADADQATHLSRFFKSTPGQYGAGDCFLGVKVPVTRAVVHDVWHNVGLQQLDACLHSQWHEIRLAALLTLIKHYQAAKGDEQRQKEYIDFYLNHLYAVNNWDLVDLSCYPLLGDWLLHKDAVLLYQLAAEGTTIWEQRIGIVSTLQFLRHDRLEDTYAIADLLLCHHHDLIHKAVGWMLREAGKRDTDRLRSYLHTAAPSTETVRCEVMPRTMLRYAIERLPEKERKAILMSSRKREATPSPTGTSSDRC